MAWMKIHSKDFLGQVGIGYKFNFWQSFWIFFLQKVYQLQLASFTLSMMYVDTTSTKGTQAHRVETQRQHRVIQHMHAVNTSKSKFLSADSQHLFLSNFTKIF